jgi:hypothetical protein
VNYRNALSIAGIKFPEADLLIVTASACALPSGLKIINKHCELKKMINVNFEDNSATA